MPVADFKTYCAILDRARAGGFALPAVNVTSLTTANAALRGLAESEADGIIQVSTGGGAFASGTALKDSALGAISIAEHVHRAAERYPIYVALHTDHCLKDKLDKFVLPLVEETEKRRLVGRPNLFNGHMFDGSNLSLCENLDIAVKLLERFARYDLVLEIETGAVGGEEDDVVGEHSAKLYTTSADTLEVARRLNPIGGRYLLAATFGNVHGVYKPGHVKLKPGVLKECQDAVVKAYGEKRAVLSRLPRRFRLDPGGDSRIARLRRGENERRYRHAICLYPTGRGTHVQELRPGAENRRRSRESKKALRPACLSRARRSVDG